MADNTRTRHSSGRHSQNSGRYLINLERIDLKITITMIALCCFGLLALYSASSYECSVSAEYNYDSAYMLKRQMLFMILGVAAILIIRYINYHLWMKLAVIFYVAGNIAVVLVLSPFGVSSHGARRWLNLVIVQFQVADLVKITTIMFLAFLAERYFKSKRAGRLTLWMWAAGALPAILLLFITSDLSSAIVIVAITFFTTFICLRTWKTHLLVLAIVAVIAVVGLVVFAHNMPTAGTLSSSNYRYGRVAAFLNPEMYAGDQGYQVLQSLYAVASGGFFGKGLGNSYQKLGAIPEAQNDMIFSIICEELGLFGAIILIGLFAYLCYQTVRVAFASGDSFGSVLAVGVFLHLSFQTIINIAVSLNLVPNTGIGLPFVSYGGSAVLCQMAEIGLVYAVERVNRKKAERNIVRELEIDNTYNM